MTEEAIVQVMEFKKWRHAIHHYLGGVSHGIIQEGVDPLKMLAWYHGLLALPVSKLSVLGDQIWDFNDDIPNASRNVRGVKMRIDFGDYPELNQLAALEVKVAMYCYIKFPSALKTFTSSGKSLKPVTVIAYFNAGLKFVNTMSVEVRKLLTDEFFENGYHGLTYFDAETYRTAASVHPFAYGSDLQRFFNVLRSPFLVDQVFDKPLPYVELESLPWAKKGKRNSGTDKKYRILPNTVFEKASREASFAVVNFLDSMGEVVQDLDALARRNTREYALGAANGLTRYKYNLYVALRLRRKGYDTKQLEAQLDDVWPEFYSDRFEDRFKSEKYLLGLSVSDIDASFHEYVNYISFCACYLVAQYTGMRPSELSEILVDSCLEQENGYWLLVSNVTKHRQSLSKLFDDKWVAIPIVRDAVRVAQFIAKVKQNPYMFSSLFTVAPGAKPDSMTSTRIASHFDSFFQEILSSEEYESLDFSAYSLRHTLAYQMARAEVGLPFISHQLKHFGDLVGGFGQNKAFSEATLDYGAICDILSKGGRSGGGTPRGMAEREYVENICDPDGSYAGPSAGEHKARLKKVFEGYMAAGYTKDEIFAQMVQKRLAVINVGQGFCYGGRKEDFDESLPCIGSLRCNPNRCKNAVVTKANAPKWREVYTQNRLALMSPASQKSEEEIRAAIDEAKEVLEYLGEEVEV